MSHSLMVHGVERISVVSIDQHSLGRTKITLHVAGTDRNVEITAFRDGENSPEKEHLAPELDIDSEIDSEKR